MSTSPVIPPLHQGIDAPEDSSSYLAESEKDSPLPKTTDLIALLSSKELAKHDLLHALPTLDGRKFEILRKNLKILGEIDRIVRVAEINAAGGFAGLK